MTCGIHVGDTGTIFRVTIQDSNEVAVDISDATGKNIIFKKPDGSNIVKDATFYTNGADGIIQYTAVSGDIDAIGAWKIQAQVTTPSGFWSSSFETFKVLRNL